MKKSYQPLIILSIFAIVLSICSASSFAFRPPAGDPLLDSIMNPSTQYEPERLGIQPQEEDQEKGLTTTDETDGSITFSPLKESRDTIPKSFNQFEQEDQGQNPLLSNLDDSNNEIKQKYISPFSKRGDQSGEVQQYDTNDISDLINKGVELGKLGKYEEAIQNFEKVLAIDPNNIAALTDKGYALLLQGHYLDAIKLFDKALDIDPHFIKALNHKGLALYHLGQYQDALNLYKEVLAIDPNNIYTLTNIGLIQFKVGLYEDSIKMLDIVLARDPQFVPALNNKGSALYQLGKYQDALKMFDKALDIDPEFILAINNKANTLVKLFEKSNDDFSDSNSFEVNNKKNKNYNYYYPISRSHSIINYPYPIQQLLTNDYLNIVLDDRHNSNTFSIAVSKDPSSLEESIKLYDRILKKNPNNQIVLINKGIVLGKLEKNDEAKDLFNQVLDMNQNNINAMCNKAKILEKEKNVTEAKYYKNKIKELEQKNTSYECDLILANNIVEQQAF